MEAAIATLLIALFAMSIAWNIDADRQFRRHPILNVESVDPDSLVFNVDHDSSGKFVLHAEMTVPNPDSGEADVYSIKCVDGGMVTQKVMDGGLSSEKYGKYALPRALMSSAMHKCYQFLHEAEGKTSYLPSEEEYVAIRDVYGWSMFDVERFTFHNFTASGYEYVGMCNSYEDALTSKSAYVFVRSEGFARRIGTPDAMTRYLEDVLPELQDPAVAQLFRLCGFDLEKEGV